MQLVRGVNPLAKRTQHKLARRVSTTRVKIMDSAEATQRRADRFLGGTGKLYKATLDSLMSYIERREIARDYIYTDTELCAITPNHILEWMNVKTFGTPNPAVDSNPISARSSSLQYWKKAISFFHPNRLMEWSSGRNEGNPTRSIEINNLIKRVKKKEVRKQGVASQTRRPMTEREFRMLHTILRDPKNIPMWRYGMSAMINFQFHVIGRIDDTTQLLIDHIRVHDSFPNCLKTKLNWSKNVGEERDAPWQIVLGSMDTTYCVLVSTAIWFELNLRANASAMNSPYLFSFCDDISIPTGGRKSKDIAQTIFGQKIFKMQEFACGNDRDAAVNACLLGSHSIRKYAATHCRRCGCNKDEKDIRGRWKARGRVSDVYDDVELPYPDAKVAEKLCIGGACYYLFPNEDPNNLNGGVVVLDETIGNYIEMMKTFVLTEVVPNIRKRLPESCALVLGKALLWFIYSNDAISNNFLPEEFKNRIKNNLSEILTASGSPPPVDGDFNPIRRVPVVVSGDQGSVFIDTVDGFVDASDPTVAGVGGGGRPATGIHAQLLALHSLATQIRRELHEIKLVQVADRALMQRHFTIVNSNVRRLAMAPARVITRAGATEGNDDDNIAGANPQNARSPAASLSSTPRNLYDLWKEYQVGLGGRKPASQFSQSERGKVKHKYCRRNVIWSMVESLVRGKGWSCDVAIECIYSVYGSQTSVTNIINAIKRDKKRGTLNPNLRL